MKKPIPEYYSRNLRSVNSVSVVQINKLKLLV